MTQKGCLDWFSRQDSTEDNIDFRGISERANHKRLRCVKEKGLETSGFDEDEVAEIIMRDQGLRPFEVHRQIKPNLNKFADFKKETLKKIGTIRKDLLGDKKDQTYAMMTPPIEICSQNWAYFLGEYAVSIRKEQCKLIFLGSNYQLSLANESRLLILDGWFKVSIPNFRQLLTVSAYMKDEDTTIPICYILLSGKRREDYDYALGFFQTIIQTRLQKKQKWDQYEFLSDYETALQNSIRNAFENCRTNSCYFHFCKAVWANLIGKVETNRFNEEKKSIYSFLKHKPFFHKVMSRLECSQRLLIEAAFELYAPQQAFKRFKQYVIKNWLQEDFDFEENDIRIQRTTNGVENLHSVFYSKNLRELKDYSIFISKLIETDQEILEKHFRLSRGSDEASDQEVRRNGLTGIELVANTETVIMEMIGQFTEEKGADPRDYFTEDQFDDWEPYNVFESQKVIDNEDEYNQFLRDNS